MPERLGFLSELFDIDSSQVKPLDFFDSRSWQRSVELYQVGRIRVVVKRFKKLQGIRVLLLCLMYYAISLVTFSRPFSLFITKEVMNMNEGIGSRDELRKIGVRLPKLYGVFRDYLVEEYVEGVNAYNWLRNSNEESCEEFGYKIGVLTGKLHNSVHTFLDNKAQNYLVSNLDIYRIDIGFLQRNPNKFQEYLDIGTFLGSLLDLQHSKFKHVQQGFVDGYRETTGRRISLRTIYIRNLVSLLLAPKHINSIPNMFIDVG